MSVNTRLHQLVSRSSRALARVVERDAVVGVTSNPTVFANALSDGDAYDEQIAASEGDAACGRSAGLRFLSS